MKTIIFAGGFVVGVLTGIYITAKAVVEIEAEIIKAHDESVEKAVEDAQK